MSHDGEPSRPSRAQAWLLLLAAWAVVLVAGHAPWLTRPFVNQEAQFWCAARAFLDPGFGEGFERYWREQANPLGYSALAASAVWLLRMPLAPWSLRLPSLAGGVLALLGGWLLARRFRPAEPALFAAFAAVLTLDPLSWVYAGEATADALPTGLAFLALALAALGREDRRWHLAAAALLAMAVLVKLNVALLAGGLLFLVLAAAPVPEGPPARRWLDLGWYVALPGAALALYAWWVRTRFGHLLLAARAWQAHGSNAGAQWPVVLLTYLSYLALLLGPLALVPAFRVWNWPRRRAGRAVAVLALVTTVVAAPTVARYAGGEMNYGSFDRMLPQALFTGLRVVGVTLGLLLLADMLFRAVVERSAAAGLAAATVVPYLVLSSLSRPSQRYLLLCLPLVVLDLLLAARPGSIRPVLRLSAATAAAFAAISLVASLAIAANARAAEGMTDWIAAHGYLEQTDPGALHGHADHRFPLTPAPGPRFVVVAGEPPGAQHVERAVVLGRPLRSYALVEAAASVSRR